MNEKIGIIGFGNMGQAIAEQLKTNYQICVFDKDKTKTAKLKNIEVALAVGGLVSKVDSLILAVKPQDLDGVLKEIKNHLQGK